jgi:hypothetical protein
MLKGSTCADLCLHRHGKIPTLKISLIQIFRAHLWQKSRLFTSLGWSSYLIPCHSSRECRHGSGKWTSYAAKPHINRLSGI